MSPLVDSVVLVTGANGGLGTEFVHQALAQGARKVYATARSPRVWSDDRVVPLRLDVTDPESVAAAAAAATDVTILINNAGAAPPSSGLLDISDDDLRANMDVNFFGPVRVAQAFAPILRAHAPSVLIDIHSALSWIALAGAYSASKAAMWSATNSLRRELHPSGVRVVGVHMGYVDTPMAAGASGAKLSPTELVAAVFDAVGSGGTEVLADDLTVGVKARLSAPIEVMYPQLADAPSAEQR